MWQHINCADFQTRYALLSKTAHKHVDMNLSSIIHNSQKDVVCSTFCIILLYWMAVTVQLGISEQNIFLDKDIN